MICHDISALLFLLTTVCIIPLANGVRLFDWAALCLSLLHRENQSSFLVYKININNSEIKIWHFKLDPIHYSEIWFARAFTFQTRMHTVGCVPSAALAISGGGQGVCAQGCLRGVSAWGCVCPGVSAHGGVCPGGFLPGGGGVHLPPMDRQTPVKT